MFIFQKNFNKEFDPIAFYNQQQAMMAVQKGQASNPSGKNKYQADGMTNGSGNHTQPALPLSKDYNISENGVTGENSLFMKSTIDANRHAAGIDQKHSTNPATGIKNTREFLNNKYGSKPETKTSNMPKFDEAALREQFKNQGMSPEQINDAIAQTKVSFDRELAAAATKDQPAVGIKVTAPANTPVVSEGKLKDPVPRKVHVNEDIPIITDEPEVEDNTLLNQFKADRAKEQAELRANTGIIRGKAQEHLDNARAKAGELKNKAVETWGNWSTNYGDGLTGSLAGDAALAAGGLALAGGAYRLMKKRRDKKQAEKAALNNKIKK